MKTPKDKANEAAREQLLRDRACLYLRHGFTVAETAREIGKSRAFVYDAKARGGRDAVPVPVGTGDPVLSADIAQAWIDAPFLGLDSIEGLSREAMRLYALADSMAAEGDKVTAFVQDSMADCLAHIDAFKDRKGN